MIKNYIKSYLYLFGIIIILGLILSLLNYFFIIPVNAIKIIIPLLAMNISSIILGKNTKEKAYMEGLKYSGLYLIFVTIIRFILKMPFNYKVFIIYAALVIVSVIGAMFGINLKNK